MTRHKKDIKSIAINLKTLLPAIKPRTHFSIPLHHARTKVIESIGCWVGEWWAGGGVHERESIYGNARRNCCVSSVVAHKQRAINLARRMPNILRRIRTADAPIGS